MPLVILPVQPIDAARRLEQYALDTAGGATATLDASSVDGLGDGSAAMRPAVFPLAEATSPQAQVELPFPCVWVAPWSRDAGLAPLRGTLALTALTADEALIDRLLAEPTIRNVYVGPHPTHWNAPNVPHDGYLADFLMESKGFIRAG